MRFGKTLKASIYSPWKDKYLEYAKLKGLLREDGPHDEKVPWTEDDESRFCEEVLNVQLEKVATFQETTLKRLEQRATIASERIRELNEEDKERSETTTSNFREIEKELESITNETKELKKYSNINYTAAIKIVKKHDRKRGNRYKIRPMLQIALSKRPFNSEQAYAPLLNRLSMMYFLIQQSLEENAEPYPSTPDGPVSSQNGEIYTAYKFWIHPENLLEVKTYILRRLPALVYSRQSTQQVDIPQGDPTVTSLYFDSPQFSLYSRKVANEGDASSLRLRWYGQLSEKPEILVEHKTISKNNSSEERRFPIKEKYVQPYINGEYEMEKTVQKFERQGQSEEKVADFKHTVSDIHKFIVDNGLQPVLRANYTRAAFQKPLDDRVRISIDTQLVFIREDSLDPDRPCRSPDDWHRSDIDSSRMEFPFLSINQGEISRFPFAVLEIKVKEETTRKTAQWIQDLMASHLVYKAPRFSKFIYGVASLFEDNVNTLPFWLSEVETDIRKDPHTAFVEEEQAKAQRAEEELLVGSFKGTPKGKGASYIPGIGSFGKSNLGELLAGDVGSKSRAMSDTEVDSKGKGRDRDDDTDETRAHPAGYGTLSSVFSTFSSSKYAQLRRQRAVQLPPGVSKPGKLLKDSGPLKVEAKVWLANERTFLKWQHICILLGGLAVGLYTVAGEDKIAKYMGIFYIAIAVFSGFWGHHTYLARRNMIVQRSGKDFDYYFGPIFVSAALLAAIVLNFIFKYHAALAKLHGNEYLNGMIGSLSND